MPSEKKQTGQGRKFWTDEEARIRARIDSLCKTLSRASERLAEFHPFAAAALSSRVVAMDKEIGGMLLMGDCLAGRVTADHPAQDTVPLLSEFAAAETPSASAVTSAAS